MEWWLATRTFLLRVWAWSKRNWKFLVGASIPLVAWLLFRNRARLEAYLSILSRLREDHRREIETIERARDMERTGIELATQRHDETVARVEDAALAANVALTEAKRQEVQTLVQKYDGDPDGLAREIARATGIPMWHGGEK
jgi:hypothetical protein